MSKGTLPGSQEERLPGVAVVIPTYNRAGLLAEALEGLLALDYPTTLLEIIVVDNSSRDNTEEVVRAAQQRSPFPLHYWRKENRGPATSRNYAIARTKAEVVAFTDSDCVVDPAWVRNGVRPLQPGVGFVAGPVRAVTHPRHPVGFFSHQIFPEILTENFLYPTANIFYRRAVLEEMGGFREIFGAYPWGSPVGGEDTDLAWRVKRAGYSSAFAPNALVQHMASPISPRSWFLDGIRAQVVPRLAAVYPEIRREFYLAHFLSPFHVVFLLAWLGLAGSLALRHPLPLLLAVPYLRAIPFGLFGDDCRSLRRWWRIPAKYLLIFGNMTVVVSTLAYASLRYRSVVL